MGLGKFLGNLTDWSKYPPRVLLVLTLICGAFLFGGSDFFKILGLDIIQAKYRPFFGLGFILFGALFFSFPIMEGVKWIYKWLKHKYDQRKKVKHYKEWFTHLTPTQKVILHSFIENNTRSMTLDFSDGTVKELANAGLIYLPSNLTLFQDEWYTDYNIQPWVFKYLKEHPEILESE